MKFIILCIVIFIVSLMGLIVDRKIIKEETGNRNQKSETEES